MADEVAMFSIELGGEGGDGSPPGGGATNVPSSGESLSKLTGVVISIEKLVGSIDGAIRRIEGKLSSWSGAPSAGSGAAVGIGAGYAAKAASSSRVGVRNVSPIGLNKSIVPFGASGMGVHVPRPGSNLALWGGMRYRQRVIDDVIDVEATVLPPYSDAAPPVLPPTGKPNRAVRGRSGKSWFNWKSFVSGLGYANPFFALRAMGVVGLAASAPLAALYLGERLGNAGLAGIGQMASYSPQIAGMSAQIGLATMMKNIQVANNPAVVAMAAAATAAETRYQQGTGIAVGVIGSVAKSAFSTFWSNLWSEGPHPNAFINAIGRTYDDIGDAIATAIWNRITGKDPGHNANAAFLDTLYGMTQGMLAMQSRLPAGAHFGEVHLGHGITNRTVRPLTRHQWNERHAP